MITPNFLFFASKIEIEYSSDSDDEDTTVPATDAEIARLAPELRKKGDRILCFKDLDESTQKKVQTEIQALTTATEYKNMINLQTWCDSKNFLMSKILSVLRSHGAAVIRLQDVYLTTESSINNAMEKEVARQIEFQCKNKATNKRLAQIKKQVQTVKVEYGPPSKEEPSAD